MKIENRVIGISILLGLLTGSIDSVIDYFVFYEKPFWDLLIFDVPMFEIYVRFIILIIFTISGFIASKTIAKHRQAEQNIKQQKDFLALVLNSLNYPFFVINVADHTISMANSAAGLEQQIGDITCHAISHQSDTPCNSGEHPCPIEIIKETKEPVTLEHIHYDQEGNPSIVEVYAYPVFDSEGDICQIIEYSIDITARKRAEMALLESEKRFRMVLETNPDPVVVYDMEGKVTYLNPAFTQIFGWTLEERTGKKLYDFVPEDSWPETRMMIDKVVAGESFSAIRSYRFKKDGKKIPVSISGSSYRDKKGNISSIVVNLQDITHQKQVEEEREKLIKDLQDALAEVKKLSGLLPICASCKKIRDDKGYWNQIEAYIQEHSEAKFSHGICPECFKKLYPDLDYYAPHLGKTI